MPNGLVQLIAGRHYFRATATVIRRSGTGPADRRAGRAPSLPAFAIHRPRQPAIPDEGRSAKNMSRSIYHVFPYPKSGYTNDAALQTHLTERSMRSDRVLKRMLLSFAAIFFLGLVGGVLGFAWLALIVIPVGALLPLAGLYYLRSPTCNCPKCNQRMKKDWNVIDVDSARYGEFLVCDACRSFVYTHRASRP